MLHNTVNNIGNNNNNNQETSKLSHQLLWCPIDVNWAKENATISYLIKLFLNVIPIHLTLERNILNYTNSLFFVSTRMVIQNVKQLKCTKKKTSYLCVACIIKSLIILHFLKVNRFRKQCTYFVNKMLLYWIRLDTHWHYLITYMLIEWIVNVRLSDFLEHISYFNNLLIFNEFIFIVSISMRIICLHIILFNWYRFNTMCSLQKRQILTHHTVESQPNGNKKKIIHVKNHI